VSTAFSREEDPTNTERPGRILPLQPGAEAILLVLAHGAVDDRGDLQPGEIAGEVVGGVHRRQERERALVGVAVAFVVDVVEDKAVDRHRPQPLQGDPGDLRGLLRARRQSRRRHREEQELARASREALVEIHARNRS
jgi:hypothetical protein